MKITGIANIVKWRIQEDGSLVEVENRVEKNTITKRVFDSIFTSVAIFTNSLRLGISTNTTATNFENLTLTNIIGVSQLISFTQSPRTDSASGFINYVFRLIPPSASRTINSIGIVAGAEIAETTPITRNSYTYLLLGSPIVQATTEIIEVSYKITLNWNNTSVPENTRLFYEANLGIIPIDNPNSEHPASRSYIRSSVPTDYSSAVCVRSTNTSSNNRYAFLQGTGNYTSALLSSPNINVQTIPYPNGNGFDTAYGLTFSNYINAAVLQAVGSCFRGFSTFGGAGLPTLVNNTYVNSKIISSNVPVQKTTNFSNVFSHSVAATAPMYDVLQLANSSWRPNISEVGGAQPALPLHYLLRVTAAGGIGTGQYKLYTSSQAGFLGNTWQNNGELSHSFSPLSPITTESDSGFIFNNRWVYPWTYTQGTYRFATYKRKAGISILSLTDRSLTEFKKYTLSSYPSLGSIINDIAVNPSSNLIYVATQTGLFSINTSTDTLTTLSTDSCATVCVGLSGVVYAVFRNGAGAGRLSSSSGGFAVAQSMGAAVVNWDNIWRIFIDPASASHNLMIYEGSNPKNTTSLITTTASGLVTPVNKYKIHWWNNSSNFISTDNINIASQASDANAVVSYFEHELLVLPTNSCVSVTNGTWIYPGNRRDSGASLTDGPSALSLEGLGHFPLEVKYDLNSVSINVAGRGWRTGESLSTSISSVAAGRIVTDSGEYRLGLHAAAAFLTLSNRDGWLCSVHVGKPNSSATVYPLRLIFGMHLSASNEIGITTPTTTPARTPSNFINIAVNQAGGSVVTDLALTNSLYYNTLNTIQQGRSVHKHSCNYHTFGNKQIIFLACPNFGLQAAATEAFPLNVTNIYNPINLPREINFGGIGFLNPLRVPTSDYLDTWLQAWQWNGTSWVVDNDNTGPGRALHTTTEDLIEGTRISWTDLQPGNSQNLILGQYYNFCRLTDPNQILVETTAPTVTTASHIFLRNFNNSTISGTVPGTPFRVRATQAPLGASPNNLFLGLPPFAQGNYTATINGLPVPVLINTSTTPPAGVIHMTSSTAGEFYFNSGAAGLPYSIQYNWIEKYHPTEIL